MEGRLLASINEKTSLDTPTGLAADVCRLGFAAAGFGCSTSAADEALEDELDEPAALSTSATSDDIGCGGRCNMGSLGRCDLRFADRVNIFLACWLCQLAWTNAEKSSDGSPPPGISARESTMTRG
jgi:hypothetical protein